MDPKKLVRNPPPGVSSADNHEIAKTAGAIWFLVVTAGRVIKNGTCGNTAQYGGILEGARTITKDVEKLLNG